MSNAPSSDASLYYFITFRLLTGSASETSIRMTALSGGRGGSTTPGAADDAVVNNVWETNRKTDHANGIHGGPIPIHKYRIHPPSNHPRLGLSAQLTPMATDWTLGMFNRDAFFIHGRGQHGSDGCIVPIDREDFRTLMTALRTSRGGVLRVLP